MAARGFAFVLMDVRLKHYNLLTTLAFVEQMTECADTLELLFSSGEVVQAVISQSDVKDMYTGISHPEIDRCVWYVVECWLSQNHACQLSR
jgi:hypothetical protein